MRAHDIDEAAALAAKQRAEEALADKSAKIDQAQALAELAQAAAQLKLLEKIRKSCFEESDDHWSENIRQNKRCSIH